MSSDTISQSISIVHPVSLSHGKRNKVAGSILKVGMWSGRIYLGEEDLWEHGLPATNDNAVRLLNLGAPIAGKPCSHR